MFMHSPPPIGSSRRNSCTLLLISIAVIAGCSTTPKDGELTPVQAEIARLEDAADASPNDASAQYALANAYFDAQRYTDARAAYGKTIDIDPRNADAFTNLGLTRRVLGDIDGAVESYQQSLELRPDDPVTLQNLVVALQAQGRGADAIAPLAHLVQLRPRDVGLLAEYAALLEAAGRFEDAALAYTEVLKSRPDDLALHYSLGRCYFEVERWMDAIGAWKSVVAFDPDFSQAYSGLAAAYFEIGDYDRAWLAVRDCQRLGAYIDPNLIARLQDASGKLGPE